MTNINLNSDHELIDMSPPASSETNPYHLSEDTYGQRSYNSEINENINTCFPFQNLGCIKSKCINFYYKHLYSSQLCANQSTPLNQSRYLLAFGYIIFISLSGNIYFGWPGLSSLLFESGAYDWLCHPEDIVTGKRYLCEAQDTAVQRLYQIAMPSHFIMSMVAGMLIDNIGPKYTAILGQSMNFTAWILLAFAKKSFNVYKLAFILIGLGADTSTLPTLNLSNLFPAYNGIVLAILGAAISASFSVPAIMYLASHYFSLSFSQISYIYAFILSLLVLYSIFSIPREVFKPHEYFESMESNEYLLHNHTTYRDSICQGFKNFIKNLYDSRRYYFSSSFMAISFYFCTTSLIVNYYVVSGEQLLTIAVNNFYGIITPFGFIATIIYGHIVDHVGPIWVMFFNTTLALSAYILANLDILALKYISTIFMTIYISIYTSQVYFFIKDRFDESHFGKLTGTASMFGGTLSIFAIFLYDPLTKYTFSGNYLYVSLMMMGLTLANFISLLFMKGHSKLLQQKSLRNAKNITEQSNYL